MIKLIYVEKDAYRYENTQLILSKLKDACVVLCDSWEEVFFKRGQNYQLQKDCQQLILGVNRGSFIFKGSDNCQSFGADEFYYCTTSKNCVFNCDYCYLSGMFKSGNLLAFVNLEDCFSEADKLFKECEENGKSLLMPISYDNDEYALEKLFGYVTSWSRFLSKRKPYGATIEVRTKCGTKSFVDDLDKDSFPYLCMTWSVSPTENIKNFEKKASPLYARLDACEHAIDLGMRTRLALDPVIAIGSFWKGNYMEFFDELERRNLLTRVEAIGVGGFRIPTDYLKTMRKNKPLSAIAFDYYVCNNGTSSYSEIKQNEINLFIRNELVKRNVSYDKIYFY